MGTVEQVKELEDTTCIGWYNGLKEVDRVTNWILKTGKRVLRIQLLEDSTNTYLVEYTLKAD
jgi:hypothetical protein